MVEEKQKRDFALVLAGLLLAIIIFIVDAFLPLGFNVSIAYLAGIILFLWVKESKYLLIYTILTSVLTIVDYFISPANGGLAYGMFNKFTTIGGLWVAYMVIRRYTRNQWESLKNEHQLNALYNAATEAIVVTDYRGAIVMANPQAHKLFEYQQGQLIGMPVDNLLPDSFRHNHEHYRNEYREHPRSRSMGMGRDLYAKKLNGDVFPVEISLSYFYQGDELFVISFIIDITKRKEAETAVLRAKQELEKYAAALKNSNHELEQFAYVASHDLQEPLRKIMAFGDRIKRKEEANLGPDSLDYLGRMLNAAERMKNLINDLLSFSRITSRGKPFEKVDLNQVVKEVLSDLEVAVEKSGASVEVEPLAVLDADPLQMRQLFQNLLGNAIKFSQTDVHPLVRVYADENNSEYIRIHVQDNGIGFDEKYVDRIFTIFQRLEGQSFEGSGVGLAICKKIVQRHGGEITARSAPGKGADFIVTLPKNHLALE